MKFTALASLMAATCVSAVPTPDGAAKIECTDPEVFNLMSLRSASPIHFGSFSAALGSIFLNMPADQQGATCEGDGHGVAYFYIQDTGLYLYDGRTTKPQQIYVDRSGMGQGKVGYLSDDEQPPRYGELEGWGTVKRGDFDYLNFQGSELIACPGSLHNSWSVWLNVNITNPGGNDGCLGMSSMVQLNEKPVSCQYS
ncbi:hypothetical protein ACO1O0_001521 [Amphichorda felina]